MLEIEFLPVEKPTLKPIPAIKKIAPWYKNIEPLRKFYGDKSHPDLTIKKCIPVLDAFTSGYYLITENDLEWKLDDDGNHICICDAKLVDGGVKPVTMHPYEQIRGIELGGIYNEYAYKFYNPYVIKTPPGYSCIFTHPFNQIMPFYTLTGVVDTDMHPLSVQFPFLMLKDYTGIIKAGTPIVQIIPFKREDWKFKEPNPSKIDIQQSSLSMSEFDMSRYDDKGNPSGGEYKKKYRVKKKYL
jgi:hypothetical protein